ncbi:bifunctional DNA primase/polymerase [Phenylobacterium sp. J426]|nr:bifunctional DNA primase/polymerase [Phenylobacterium sp. J426]
MGLAVFGVAADCRAPIKREGWFEHGCKDASKDILEVQRRWTRAHPTANIAVATGEASGVFVLDIDCKEGGDGYATLARLEAEFGELPPTWRSRTPSGGEHRWFRFSDKARALRNWAPLKLYRPDGTKEVCAGLDIRTTHGSAAVPPSRKPTGAYTWIVKPTDAPLADPPAWLCTVFIPPPPPPRAAAPIRLDAGARQRRYVETAINAECRAVAEHKPGGRNLRLFQAAANLGELVGANLLPEDAAIGALEQAAQDCGLHTDDGGWEGVRKTIQSGLRRGMANPREVRA